MIRQKATRSPTAAALLPMTAILRCASGSERVARAITTALSPDNRISMHAIRTRSTKKPCGTKRGQSSSSLPSLNSRAAARPMASKAIGNPGPAYISAIRVGTLYRRIGTVPPDSTRLTIAPDHPPFELGALLATAPASGLAFPWVLRPRPVDAPRPPASTRISDRDRAPQLAYQEFKRRPRVGHGVAGGAVRR